MVIIVHSVQLTPLSPIFALKKDPKGFFLWYVIYVIYLYRISRCVICTIVQSLLGVIFSTKEVRGAFSGGLPSRSSSNCISMYAFMFWSI
jgi:hypothetical protein